MNYDERIASGIRDLDDARRFQELFPGAEHVIVQAKRQAEPDGWGLIDEWISRANLYDRYALWLVLPIEFSPDGVVSALEQPTIYMIEVEKVENGRDDKEGPKWECSFGQFEEGAWKEIVEAGGDFAALGVDLLTNAPVENFAIFWRGTRPPPDHHPAPEDIALRAPLRFMS